MNFDCRLDLATQREQGRALRTRQPREAAGAWSPRPDRPEAVACLETAVAGRDRDALALRWSRMAASPYAFFRGNTGLMAWDLSKSATTGLACQLSGDPHLLNFGAYAAPNGTLVFDLNDFDESCRGPWEWDLERLAVSVLLGGEQAGHDRTSASEAVLACVEAYRNAVHRFSEMGALALARACLSESDSTFPLGGVFERASRETPSRLFEKAMDPGSGSFWDRPPGLRPLSTSEGAPYLEALPAYRLSLSPPWRDAFDRHAPRACGRRISGCGSMGVRNVLVACEGQRDEDWLFLEFKAQPGSAWAAYAEADAQEHRGQAVCTAKQRLQTWSDPYLGWSTVEGAPFLVKQWSNQKASLDLEELAGSALKAYATSCATVLAKAHARTGHPGVLAGYLGHSQAFDEALLAFAGIYADQVLRDWEALKVAIRNGRVLALS